MGSYTFKWYVTIETANSTPERDTNLESTGSTVARIVESLGQTARPCLARLCS